MSAPIRGWLGLGGVKLIADRLIAHRGCSLLRPENTLAAMRLTRDIGVKWVEIDANLLGDGTVVMFHDDVLDRLTPARGPLSECTLSDVEALDVGSHFSAEYSEERFPTLADALRVIDELGLSLNLEIKVYPHFEAEQIVAGVVELLSECWTRFDQLIISSFSTEALRLVRQQKPDWMLGQLWQTVPDDWQTTAEELSLVSAHCDYRHLTMSRTEAIKSHGLDIYCYTVNDRVRAEVLWAQGVDGLITDNPLLFNI